MNILALNVLLINIKIDGFPTQWRSFLTKQRPETLPSDILVTETMDRITEP